MWLYNFFWYSYVYIYANLVENFEITIKSVGRAYNFFSKFFPIIRGMEGEFETLPLRSYPAMGGGESLVNGTFTTLYTSRA